MIRQDYDNAEDFIVQTYKDEQMTGSWQRPFKYLVLFLIRKNSGFNMDKFKKRIDKRLGVYDAGPDNYVS